MAEEPEDQKKEAAKIYIIKRKKAGHAGHHGGAWKVAYADFVTAMMALFIVLWLMNTDPEVKQAISAFFKDPSGPGKLTGTAAAGFGNALDVKKADLERLRSKIQEALMQLPDFKRLQDHVEVTITSDGLRIELLESEGGMFFESGRGTPSPNGAELLSGLARELGTMPNLIAIEGHTDAKPYSGDGTYTNWELSSDRANAARRLMEANGLRADQISQVRGYADRELRHPEDPLHASNRRISVIVQYRPGPSSGAKAEGSAEKLTPEKPADAPKPENPPPKAPSPPPTSAALH
jgi:chemotaxis protein MotB